MDFSTYSPINAIADLIVLSVVVFIALYIHNQMKLQDHSAASLLKRLIVLCDKNASYVTKAMAFHKTLLEEINQLHSTVRSGIKDVRGAIDGVGDTVVETAKQITDLQKQFAKNEDDFQKLKGEVQDLEHKKNKYVN